VTRYASTVKTTIDRAECHVELDWFLEGSILRGTVNSGATRCHTRFIIDSPEPEEDVLRVVRLAKQGCFGAHGADRDPPRLHLRDQRRRAGRLLGVRRPRRVGTAAESEPRQSGPSQSCSPRDACFRVQAGTAGHEGTARTSDDGQESGRRDADFGTARLKRER
jgi:hypothetical protein